MKKFTIISGKKVSLISIQIILTVMHLAWTQSKNPYKVIKLVLGQISNRKKIYGNKQITKLVSNGNRFFYTTDIPGWPSPAYNTFTISEFKRQLQLNITERPLQTAIVSITSSCPLNCQHCFESTYINSNAQLSLESLKNIVKELSTNGISHIQLSGGEPLSRYDDLLELVKTSSKEIDYWLLTSGFGLSADKAFRLKEAGLTGMHISLDHFEEEMHNRFRGNVHSFQQALNAVQYCNNAGMVTCLSLTATPEFVTRDNMFEYIRLAKNHNVGFIRLLEARSVGRYSKANTELSIKQLEILDDIYLKSLTDKSFSNYAIIDYPGYHQRRLGCFGAGNRYLYIDSAGNYHSCPFCQNKIGNINKLTLQEARIKLQENRCEKYELTHV